LVTDGNNPGGGTRLDYDREIACSGPSDCFCTSSAPAGTGAEGSECRTDCSCGPGLSCIGEYTLGGPTWTCLRPCNDFLDCGSDESCSEPVPDGIPWVCVGSWDQCSTDHPCPDGFDCVRDTADAPNRCVDRRSAEPRPDAALCSCDGDCAVGERCVSDGMATPSCAIPCLRGVDCPLRGEPGVVWNWSCDRGLCGATDGGV
jgi:hypothetical protein